MANPVRNDRVARLIEWQRFVLTKEGKAEFLQRLLGSMDIGEVCREMDLPEGRVLAFVASQAELNDAAKAILELKAHQMAAEALEIADEQKEVIKRDGSTFDPDVGRDKLRVETRLKLIEKWAKGMYAPKSGADVGAMAEGITEALQRISERRRKEKLVEQGAGGVDGERMLAAPRGEG